VAVVDLRSDTVTAPTPAMRAAMAAAEVGDDAYGEDPTVRRLESLTAALLGHEAGLFVPSGTMGNQLALAVLAGAGDEVGCADRAHVRRYESGGAAANFGIQLRPLGDGLPAADAIAAATADQRHHLPPFVAVTVENTYMPASGRPWSSEELAPVVATARALGLGLHVDGARIWNAAIATGCSPAALTAGADTVMCCLSKGLAAPVGSVLVGGADRIARARALRHRLGGGMRQAGILAAAGVVALETMVERLADDHARAHRLAVGLAERVPGSVDPDAVRTNVVCVDATVLPGGAPGPFLDRLAAHGVRAGSIDARTVRFVTHVDVDDTGIDRTLAAVDALVGEG
jgi:threonine aldolase